MVSLGDHEVVISHHLTSDGKWQLGGSLAGVPLSAVDSCTVRMTDIPTLRFTLPDNPDLDWIVEKDTYLAALLDVDGGGIYDSLPGLELNVRGRGNSTWSMPKRPMRLKFNKKTSLFGLTKAKSYVLLAEYIDPSQMHNATAHRLAGMLGVPWPLHLVPCHVYFNGRYAGAYTLCEKIGIGSASVDIDDTKGMLFELSTEFDEPFQFRSTHLDLPVMVKDPDLEEICSENPALGNPATLLQAWQEDFNRAEALVMAGRGAEAFDMASLAAFVMVNNVALNDEIGFPKSIYVSKEALGDGCKYLFGPVWDFDAAFNLSRLDDDGGIYHKSPGSKLWVNPLFSRLMATPEFKQAYTVLWEDFLANLYPELKEWLSGYACMIEPSAMLDGQKWPEENDLKWCIRESSFDRKRHVAQLLEWIELRVEYLKGRMAAGQIL